MAIIKIFIFLIWSLPLLAGEVLFDEEVKINVAGSTNKWFASPHKNLKKLWYFDANGKPIAESFVFDNGPDSFSKDLIRFRSKDKVGLLDQNGKIMLAPKFNGIKPVESNQIDACINGKHEVLGEHVELVNCRWMKLLISK